MQLEFTDEAQRDLQALNQPQLEAVKQKLAELREQPTSHDDAKPHGNPWHLLFSSTRTKTPLVLAPV